MALSRSAADLRVMIEKAIEDHQLTRAEMDMIIHVATRDGQVDSQEYALLEQLNTMIDNREVKIVP